LYITKQERSAKVGELHWTGNSIVHLAAVYKLICHWCSIIIIIIIIIINPCKPYLSASAPAPHPLGRRKAD
jgi:hypothetical protein